MASTTDHVASCAYHTTSEAFTSSTTSSTTLPVVIPGAGNVEKRKYRVLLGCTGSVASVKIPLIIARLKEYEDIEMRLVVTQNATHFFDFAAVDVTKYTDEDEWKAFEKLGDRVVHIDLRSWADIFVIAPLDANTLAKLANGLCDNLLTCIARAWDFRKPFIVCPAMNTHMWDHPFTAKQLLILESLGIQSIAPVVKTLACGDVGQGAMAHVETITDAIRQHVESSTQS